MNQTSQPAPAWQVQEWLNSPHPITLDALRGRVVVMLAFQMLCPGCVSHALPQAMRVRGTFADDQVAVLGLHTVFEHHAAMTPLALQAFLHEYRITFPVGVDRPSTTGPVPETMSIYAMRGTPTLLLVDREGRLRGQHFGEIDDLRLGAEIMALITEPSTAATAGDVNVSAGTATGDCAGGACAVDPRA